MKCEGLWFTDQPSSARSSLSFCRVCGPPSSCVAARRGSKAVISGSSLPSSRWRLGRWFRPRARSWRLGT